MKRKFLSQIKSRMWFRQIGALALLSAALPLAYAQGPVPTATPAEAPALAAPATEPVKVSTGGPTLQIQKESKTCFECHEEETKSYEHGLHRKAWASVKGHEGKSCAACHGDATEHVRTKGKAAVLGYTRKAGTDPSKLNKSCLECHGSSSHVSMWQTSAHARNGVSCASCHTMHKGPLAMKPTSQTCMECHREQKLQSGMLSHHPIKEGKVSCFDCHNPHGTGAKSMLVGDSTNQTCYKCHADKRGPYLWEHTPVEENCSNCHNPHGTRNAALLVEKQPYLCQRCHDWTQHPGTMFTGTASNINSRMIGRSCTNCHGKIHGSYAPANPSKANSSNYNSGNYLVH